MTSMLRPDEKAADSQIERSKSFDNTLKKGVKTAAGVGMAAAGLGASARILPFLSELIPTDLAIKGINKVSPQIGKFLQKGMSQGLDVKDGLQFLKDSLGEQQEPAKENRSIIEQYSPELHQFIMGEIQKGRSPLEAGALAQSQTGFKKVIAQMSKDHKIPFSAILESTFGGGQMAQQPQSKAALQQPQQAQPQNGNSDQALLAALEKILTM